MLLRIATYVVAPYAATVLLMFLLQRRLIYFPNMNRPSAATLHQHGLKFWPRAETYRGLVSVAPPRRSKGTVVVFHGNNSLASQRGHYVRALERLDYRVVLAEYPVYGGRNGGLSETEFVTDAKETLRLAREEFGGPVFVIGESLGTGVANAVAAGRRPDSDHALRFDFGAGADALLVHSRALAGVGQVRQRDKSAIFQRPGRGADGGARQRGAEAAYHGALRFLHGAEGSLVLRGRQPHQLALRPR
jgi:alpha-beta hydrolase superfamily lysophospholipase